MLQASSRSAVHRLVLTVGLCCACAGVAAQSLSEFEIGAFHDSNLSRAALASDIKSDSVVYARAWANKSLDLIDDLQMTLTLDLGVESYARYSRMSNLTLGLTASARHKFGLGPQAPWLQGAVSATRLQFRDSLRTGWLYNVSLSAGKRLSDDWDLRVDLTHDRRTADEVFAVVPFFSGDSFGVAGTSLAFKLNYAASRDLLLTAGYGVRNGDITATAVHTQAIWDASTAWSKDMALGDDNYRIKARTQMFDLAASLALGERSSVNASVSRWRSKTYENFDYSNTVLRLNWLHSFD